VIIDPKPVLLVVFEVDACTAPVSDFVGGDVVHSAVELEPENIRWMTITEPV